VKTDLKTHMLKYKEDQDKKRNDMRKQIGDQKELIKVKEQTIHDKNKELEELKETNKVELSKLSEAYDEEVARKQELEAKLLEVRTELSNIE